MERSAWRRDCVRGVVQTATAQQPAGKWQVAEGACVSPGGRHTVWYATARAWLRRMPACAPYSPVKASGSTIKPDPWLAALSTRRAARASVHARSADGLSWTAATRSMIWCAHGSHDNFLPLHTAALPN